MNYEPEIDTIIELSEQGYVWPDPIEEVIQKDVVRVLNDCIDSLTPREAKVVRLKFGLDRDRDYTFDEIGKMFEVTGGRVQQILSKALRKMRHPARSHKIALASPDITVISDRQIKEYAEKEKLINSQKPVSGKTEPPKPRKSRWIDIPVDEKGWVDGSKYKPNFIGVYERTDGNYIAFSKWDGDNWLQGSQDVYKAGIVTRNYKSGFQKLNWRTIKTGEI